MNKKVTTTLLGLAILSAGMIPANAQRFRPSNLGKLIHGKPGAKGVKRGKIPELFPKITRESLQPITRSAVRAAMRDKKPETSPRLSLDASQMAPIVRSSSMPAAPKNVRALSTFPILSGQEVLIRVDYNVPIEEGKVVDNTRIKETLPTLRYVLEQGGKPVLISHAGRPKGEVNLKYSLRPMFEELQRLLPEYKGYFATDCVGPEAKKVVQQAKNGEFVLLENLRFHPEEEANDPAFAKQLADLVKSTPMFVEEAFGTVHRAHASTVGVSQYLPTVAGFLVEKELSYLNILRNSKEPMAVVFGGSKLGDKIPVINALVENPNVKAMFFGGGIGYTLLKAKGVEVGKSLVDNKNLEVAKEILAKAEANGIEVFLAQDFRLNATGEFIPTAEAQVSDFVPADMESMDIGPKTAALYALELKKYKKIFWNGPMGVFEFPNFANGSFAVAKAMEEAYQAGAMTFIGGGDTPSILTRGGFNPENQTHIFTGGGATLEGIVDGMNLPGLHVLKK